MAKEIESSNFGVVNEPNPMRLTANTRSSLMDITLASSTPFTSIDWEVDHTLRSDHLPIIVYCILQKEIQVVYRRLSLTFHQQLHFWLTKGMNYDKVI